MKSSEIEIVQRHFNAMCDELIRRKEEPVTIETTQQEGYELKAQRRAPSDDLLEAVAHSKWALVGTREGETYSWPEGPDQYASFAIYESDNPELDRYAIGKVEAIDREYWGTKRPYFVVFRLPASGTSKQPIAVFVAADDYSTTREYVAAIRGAGGPRGQRMFAPSDAPPMAYESLRVVTFRDHVAGTPQFGGYDKLAVLVDEDDVDSAIRHAAIQVALRH